MMNACIFFILIFSLPALTKANSCKLVLSQSSSANSVSVQPAIGRLPLQNLIFGEIPSYSYYMATDNGKITFTNIKTQQIQQPHRRYLPFIVDLNGRLIVAAGSSERAFPKNKHVLSAGHLLVIDGELIFIDFESPHKDLTTRQRKRRLFKILDEMGLNTANLLALRDYDSSRFYYNQDLVSLNDILGREYQQIISEYIFNR